MPIRVVNLANLINKINLMLNYTFIIPYMAVLSYILILSLLNTKNWPYSAINYLDTLILIIIPTKLSIVYWDMNIVIL